MVISGLISLSPLAVREAHAATGIRCLTAQELQRGDLNRALSEIPFVLHRIDSGVLREHTAA
jgi:hypothetical protein